MGSLWQDLRFGLRGLSRHPSLTAVAVVSLGLGIGANATAFTWLRGFVLRPLPAVSGYGRLVTVDTRAPGGESLTEVAERVRSFADEIAERHAGQIVLVVTHGLSLAALRCLAVGLPLAEAIDLVPDNCSIVRIFWPHPLVSDTPFSDPKNCP